MFGWFKQRRRKKLIAQPFPRPWQELLHRSLWQYRQLSMPERDKLHECTKVIVGEVNWEGCDGLIVNEDMKVTVAGHASMMLMGTNDYYFDGVRSILIYPREFGRELKGTVVGETEIRAGEAWQGGPILLSWHHVLNATEPGNGYNIIVHEFAHHLDGLDGEMGGTPIFDSESDQRSWAEVMAIEFEDLCSAASSGQWTILRHYGAKNRAEFFAVASECFFETPVPMQRTHTELYDLLRRFYRQNPVEWLT